MFVPERHKMKFEPHRPKEQPQERSEPQPEPSDVNPNIRDQLKPPPPLPQCLQKAMIPPIRQHLFGPSLTISSIYGGVISSHMDVDFPVINQPQGQNGSDATKDATINKICNTYRDHKMQNQKTFEQNWNKNGNYNQGAQGSGNRNWHHQPRNRRNSRYDSRDRIRSPHDNAHQGTAKKQRLDSELNSTPAPCENYEPATYSTEDTRTESSVQRPKSPISRPIKKTEPKTPESLNETVLRSPESLNQTVLRSPESLEMHSTAAAHSLSPISINESSSQVAATQTEHEHQATAEHTEVAPPSAPLAVNPEQSDSSSSLQSTFSKATANLISSKKIKIEKDLIITSVAPLTDAVEAPTMVKKEINSEADVETDIEIDSDADTVASDAESSSDDFVNDLAAGQIPLIPEEFRGISQPAPDNGIVTKQGTIDPEVEAAEDDVEVRQRHISVRNILELTGGEIDSIKLKNVF